MFEAEQRSWWFRGRRRILDAVIARMGLPPSARIADVGCGTGGNLLMLARHGRAVGVEPSPDGAAFARERTGEAIVVAGAESTGLEPSAFDLVTMFDVLEHLEDEAPALAEVRRLLAAGGRFLFTVPAFMLLWSGHDVALHHHRRYRRRPLAALLEREGFTVDHLTYYNAALFPAVAAIRIGRRMVAGGAAVADVADAARGPAGWALEGLFAAERHLVDRVTLPFGVSLLGVARARHLPRPTASRQA